MRDDWALFDFGRSFMPSWLAKMTSAKVLSAALLALLLFVVALKMGR